MKHRVGGFVALGLGVIALLVFLLPGVRAQSEVNTIKSLQTVAGGGVEVEVHSTREFPVRNDVVILRIGAQEFTHSRSPQDGSLNTLIFGLTPAEWAGVKTGESVTVYFGQDDPKDTTNRWVFGTLNKSLLKP